MDAAVLRSWWAARQALPLGMAGAAPAVVLERTGWARSVGGVNPYLTLFARAGTSREAADRAVADLQIHELPSARGCTYVVPASDHGLALTLARGFVETGDLQTARKFLGVTDAEIDLLCERVLGLVGTDPMDPAELKKALGDAVRSFGPEGKKRGVTTTLPLALGRLQAHGEIRRRPVNGRLDQQRFGYVRWENAPTPLSADEAYTELARRYFRWIGPASLAHFRWFSGLGVAAAKAAIAPLGLVPLEAEGDLLVRPEDREAVFAHVPPSEPAYSLVSGLDGLALLRRDLRASIDPADLDRHAFSDGAERALGGLSDLPHHAIFDRGRLVGLWEYDVEATEIAWTSFGPADEALRAAVARMEAFVRQELGDARSFSLDSPASRKAAIRSLRGSAFA
ncbi:MAG: DNA glycosylase AlkZ-like family protein [Fimbriimonas sp.]